MADTAKSQLFAVAEVTAVAAAYIAISVLAVLSIEMSWLFPADWGAPERSTGAGFLIGALVQVTLVLIAAYVLNLRDVRAAISAATAPSTRAAWTIAAIATAIHIGTAMLAILPRPGLALQPTAQNLLLSVIPAADGWSQEILFRGYVLYRLARAKVSPLTQILLSGMLFAAIHIGYAGSTPFEMAVPLIGTFMLGSFYAWAVQMGGGSLKPVICLHVLIILVLQPWLALAR